MLAPRRSRVDPLRWMTRTFRRIPWWYRCVCVCVCVCSELTRVCGDCWRGCLRAGWPACLLLTCCCACFSLSRIMASLLMKVAFRHQHCSIRTPAHLHASVCRQLQGYELKRCEGSKRVYTNQPGGGGIAVNGCGRALLSRSRPCAATRPAEDTFWGGRMRDRM